MKKNYESPSIETTILGFSLMQTDELSGKNLENGDGGTGVFVPGGGNNAPARKPF